MLISVCIPTFNQGMYLEQCIRSLMAQSLQPNEIIVSNDCSTDNTTTVLNRLQSETSGLHVINQPVNIGMVKNTNLCLKLAKHDYIVKLDSDDYLLPGFIETLSGLLFQYPEAGYAHSAVQEIDEFDNKGKVRRLFRKTGFHASEEALRSSCNGYQVAANIIMFRKSALQSANYITSKVQFAEDFFLSVEIANAGFGNVYIDEVLSCYRVWADEKDVRQKRKLNEINGLKIVFNEPLTASFVKRGWNLDVLAKKKKQFACRHSDCLMWKIYSKEEKRELEEAIYKLSSAVKVRLYAYLYKKGYGKLILIPSGLWNTLKQAVKDSMLRKRFQSLR